MNSAITVLLLTCIRPLFSPGVGPLHGVILLILPKVDPRNGRQRIDIRPTALLGAIALPIREAMPIDQVVPAGGVVANQDAISDAVPPEGLGGSDGAGGYRGRNGRQRRATAGRGRGTAIMVRRPLGGRRRGGRRHLGRKSKNGSHKYVRNLIVRTSVKYSKYTGYCQWFSFNK